MPIKCFSMLAEVPNCTVFSETGNSGVFYGDDVQALFYQIHSSQISLVSTSYV